MGGPIFCATISRMIRTAQHCISGEPFFDRYAPSESTPGQFYTVRINFVGDPSDQWTCTCPSFAYRGNCKHIKMMAGFNICHWHELVHQETQTEQQKIDHICPGCGNMTVDELEDDGT